MMLRHAVALAILVMLTGCSDSVTLVEPDKLAGFETGKTNQTEIVAALGKPLETVIEADGSKIDQYPYTDQPSGSSFMPAFLGGGPDTDDYGMVSFIYGPGGVLKEIIGAKVPPPNADAATK